MSLSPFAALLVIDAQYLGAARDHFDAAPAVDDAARAAREAYLSRVEEVAVPNIRRLQDTFRRLGREVIHTRIQSMTLDGRDRSPGHKRLGLHAAPGSREAEFLPGVTPVGDELVFNKTASGVFSSTNIEYVLRNLGVTKLYVAGFYTDECVSTAVRDASDLGFSTVLVEDACAAFAPGLHEAAVSTLRDRYAEVQSTDQVLAGLS